MTLPDEAVIQVGTDVVVANTADHAPAAANNFGAQTDQINLIGVADGEARESDKINLPASRSGEYAVFAALEFAATPGAASAVEFYWADSPSTTDATGNLGGLTGADADFTGLDSDLANVLKNFTMIGILVTTNDPTGVVQSGKVGTLRPRNRYGSLIVVNESGAALHSDAVEMSVLISPQVNRAID